MTRENIYTLADLVETMSKQNADAVQKTADKVCKSVSMSVALNMLEAVHFSSVADAYNLTDNVRERNADGEAVSHWITRKTLYNVWETLEAFGYNFTSATAVAVDKSADDTLAVYARLQKDGVVKMPDAIVKYSASYIAKNEAIIQSYVDDIALAKKRLNKARKDGKSVAVVKD